MSLLLPNKDEAGSHTVPSHRSSSWSPSPKPVPKTISLVSIFGSELHASGP